MEFMLNYQGTTRYVSPLDKKTISQETIIRVHGEIVYKIPGAYVCGGAAWDFSTATDIDVFITYKEGRDIPQLIAELEGLFPDLFFALACPIEYSNERTVLVGHAYVDGIQVQFIWTPFVDAKTIVNNFDMYVCRVANRFTDPNTGASEVIYGYGWTSSFFQPVDYAKVHNPFTTMNRLVKYATRLKKSIPYPEIEELLNMARCKLYTMAGEGD